MSRVLDLGSGCGDVQRFLHSSSEMYIPSDIRSRDFPVLECDLSRELPDVSNPSVIFVLGVLEWLCDTKSFLQALRTYNAPIVMSYTAEDLHVPHVPLANSFTSTELESALIDVGFSIRSKSVATIRSRGYEMSLNLIYYLD